MNNNTRRYRYDMIGGPSDRHPQEVILEHFPDAHDFVCVGPADVWLFTAEPCDDLPDYIVEQREPPPLTFAGIEIEPAPDALVESHPVENLLDQRIRNY